LGLSTFFTAPSSLILLQNDLIREKIGVTPIEEKMTENRLRWFWHVQRRPQEVPIRGVDCMIFSLGKRRRGKPKRILEEIIKGDLKLNNILKLWVF